MNKPVQALTKILANWDVMGLIGFGAPADEYESEAEKIYQSFQQNPQQEIATLIKDVFVDSFCVAYEMDEDGELVPSDEQIAEPSDWTPNALFVHQVKEALRKR